MSASLAARAFAFDPLEVAIMSMPLAELVKRIAEDDRATIAPPPRGAK